MPGQKVKDWKPIGIDKFAEYAEKYPAEAAEFKRRMAGELPRMARARGWTDRVLHAKEETIASRKASQNAIEGLGADITGTGRRLCRLGRVQSDPLVGLKRRQPGRLAVTIFIMACANSA